MIDGVGRGKFSSLKSFEECQLNRKGEYDGKKKN